jgi:hypothetical protein
LNRPDPIDQADDGEDDSQNDGCDYTGVNIEILEHNALVPR